MFVRVWVQLEGVSQCQYEPRNSIVKIPVDQETETCFKRPRIHTRLRAVDLGFRLEVICAVSSCWVQFRNLRCFCCKRNVLHASREFLVEGFKWVLAGSQRSGPCNVMPSEAVNTSEGPSHSVGMNSTRMPQQHLDMFLQEQAHSTLSGKFSVRGYLKNLEIQRFFVELSQLYTQ